MTVPTDMPFDAGAQLKFEDEAIDRKESPSVMEIYFKASKPDPYRKGINIILYVGRTGNALRPISAMLAYLAVCGDIEGLHKNCKIFCMFSIFVVCANHENIFTTKISRSTVDASLRRYFSCDVRLQLR